MYLIIKFNTRKLLPVCPCDTPGGHERRQHLAFMRFKLVTNKKLRPY